MGGHYGVPKDFSKVTIAQFEQEKEAVRLLVPT